MMKKQGTPDPPIFEENLSAVFSLSASSALATGHML
jgi:hypothetical protein